MQPRRHPCDDPCGFLYRWCGNSYHGNERMGYVMTARSSLSVRDAANILGITDQATINEIRSRYHTLVKKWHPDVSQRDPEKTHTAMIRINDAYDVLIDYCMNFEFSFRPEDIRDNVSENPSDSWMERYGDDPIWGPRRYPHNQD